MAKKILQPETNPNRWEDTLPSVYSTLIEGFHAKRDVRSLVTLMGLQVDVPDTIKKIPVGAFTPDIFKLDQEFWSKPISKEMLEKHPALYDAVMDQDIADIQLENDYLVDTNNVTLETVARTLQTQYLGFNIRMAQLTNNNLFARLEKLKEENFYQNLKNYSLLERHGLVLPKNVPNFKCEKKKFSVKSVSTAVGKAYGRTGKPKSHADFFDAPDKYGVFAVHDLQRTSLSVYEERKSKEQTLKDYNDLRNIILTALYSGELGVVVEPDNITDRVNYPDPIRLSQQFPVFLAKGMIYHAGPDESYIEAPLELQIGILSPDIVETTHRLYELTRANDVKPEEIKQLNTDRLNAMNCSLPTSVQEARALYMRSKKIPKEDVFAHKFLATDSLLMTDHARRQAKAVSRSEFPWEYPSTIQRGYAENKEVVLFDPFMAHGHPTTIATLKRMVQSGLSLAGTAEQDDTGLKATSSVYSRFVQ